MSISIHALREEGDRSPWKSLTFPRYFYPRPPRGGRRLHRAVNNMVKRFLSTPSARRATDSKTPEIPNRQISIHALREEGDHCRNGSRCRNRISIHALREEGDERMDELSTHPNYISIHALREEGDARSASTVSGASLFLSTPSARRATVYAMQFCPE